MFCTSLMLLGLRIFHPIPNRGTDGSPMLPPSHLPVSDSASRKCRPQNPPGMAGMRSANFKQQDSEKALAILSSTTAEVNCSFLDIDIYDDCDILKEEDLNSHACERAQHPSALLLLRSVLPAQNLFPY